MGNVTAHFKVAQILMIYKRYENDLTHKLILLKQENNNMLCKSFFASLMAAYTVATCPCMDKVNDALAKGEENAGETLAAQSLRT